MKGYDEKYLQSCIDKAKKSWEGVDTDKFMNEIRGREDAPNEELNKAAEQYAQDETMSGLAERAFKAGAEWQRERMEDEHGKALLYVCQKTAEREHRGGVREGKAQTEKELIPLINRLCEAILFEWKDMADLARKTLTQIKAREEEK